MVGQKGGHFHQGKLYNLQVTIKRPSGLHSGFHASLEDAGVPGLVHAGDQRAPRSWFIPAHHHDVWELYLQLDGPPTRWRAAGAEYEVPAGTLLAVPPRTLHRMVERAPASYHFYFAAIDPASLLAGSGPVRSCWRDSAVLTVNEAGGLAAPFEAFLREVTTDQRFRAEGLRHTATHLLVEAARCLLPGAPRYDLAVHPAVWQAKRMLDGDLAADLKLADLAAAVHLAPTYLAGLFAEQMGITPARYRNRARLRRAATLLAETELPITAIAAELGFSSPQHFATAFRRQTGTSPGRFRGDRR